LELSFLIESEFRISQVLNLRNKPRFKRFAWFFLFFISFFYSLCYFSFIIQHLFNWRLGLVICFCFILGFSLILKITRVISPFNIKLLWFSLIVLFDLFFMRLPQYHNQVMSLHADIGVLRSIFYFFPFHFIFQYSINIELWVFSTLFSMRLSHCYLISYLLSDKIL